MAAGLRGPFARPEYPDPHARTHLGPCTHGPDIGRCTPGPDKRIRPATGISPDTRWTLTLLTVAPWRWLQGSGCGKDQR